MSFMDNGEGIWPEPTAELNDAIPERCKDCGVQCELAGRLGRAVLLKSSIMTNAEKLMKGSDGTFDARIDEMIDDPEEAEFLKKDIRERAAGGLDEADEVIARIKDMIDSNATACDGPLKMRATKGDVTYTVTVCTSPDQYDPEGAGHVPTHIKRNPA